MTLKFFKPITPSQRNLIQLKNSNFKNPLLKFKIKKLKKSSGRNNTGQITVYHKGSGHKKKYRFLKKNAETDYIGILCSIEYDPYRNTNISAVYNILVDRYFYVISPLNIKIGDIISSGIYAKINLGHNLQISQIPVGSFIYNISDNSKSPEFPQYSKSAGAYSYILEKTLNQCKIRLSSGKIQTISSKSTAFIGMVSNSLFFLTSIGKAGRSRWLNKRPIVRGVAMNPVDHPHGGGEGKTSGGRPSVTPWGKPAKNGKKTSRS